VWRREEKGGGGRHRGRASSRPCRGHASRIPSTGCHPVKHPTASALGMVSSDLRVAWERGRAPAPPPRLLEAQVGPEQVVLAPAFETVQMPFNMVCCLATNNEEIPRR
jgi:hypothetical protein